MNRIVFHSVVWIVLLSCLQGRSFASTATLSFDSTKTFPFPHLILGSQEEVFFLPYITTEQFQYFHDIGQSVLRYPCGTPSDWFAWDNVEKGYWDSDFTRNRLKMKPEEYYDLC